MLLPLATMAAGGGCAWILKSNRRKAAAEASITEFTLLHNAIAQINELQLDAAAKHSMISELRVRVDKLTADLFDAETRYDRSRCDMEDCRLRVRKP